MTKKYKTGRMDRRRERVQAILQKDVTIVETGSTRRPHRRVKDRDGSLKEILDNIRIERGTERIEKLQVKFEEQKRLAMELIDRTEDEVEVQSYKAKLSKIEGHVSRQIEQERRRVGMKAGDAVRLAGHHLRNLILFTHPDNEVMFKQYTDLVGPLEWRERAKSPLYQRVIKLLKRAWKKRTAESTEMAISRGRGTYQGDIIVDMSDGDAVRLTWPAFRELLIYAGMTIEALIRWEYKLARRRLRESPYKRAKLGDHKELISQLSNEFNEPVGTIKRIVREKSG